MFTESELNRLAIKVADLLKPILETPARIEDEYLDVCEAARLLKCSVPTVERRTRSGEIPSVKIGHLRRYRRSSILSLTSDPPESQDDRLQPG